MLSVVTESFTVPPFFGLSYGITSYYTDMYMLLKAGYTRKGTLCAGIKLYKMVAISTLLLPVQSHLRLMGSFRCLTQQKLSPLVTVWIVYAWKTSSNDNVLAAYRSAAFISSFFKKGYSFNTS